MNYIVLDAAVFNYYRLKKIIPLHRKTVIWIVVYKMAIMKKIGVLVIFLVLAVECFAQADWVLGEWRTVDDKTGETKGIVEFYQDEDTGLYYGRILRVFYNGEELEDSGFENMIVIKDMKEEDGILQGGIIYEPEGKKNYYGNIYHNEDNTITLRGSLDRRGWLGRSQTWVR